MLTVNGHKYAANNKEFTESLFCKGGTCAGYYKKTRNKILFSDMQGDIFAALVRNKHGNHLVSTTRLEDGKIFYMYGLATSAESVFFPAGLGYMAKKDSIDNMVNELL